ncbi:MAG: hypothetical protein ABII26_01150 [Pseudomonadota bacterium]
MKRSFLFSILIIIPFLLISCSNSERAQNVSQPHIGKWSGVDSNGTKATISFKEDGTGTIEFNNDLYQFTYVFDYSKKPTWLDLIYSREGKPFRAKLIVKFLDGNRLKWRTFFNAQRPDDFPPDDKKYTMVLTRDKPIRET